LLAPTSGSAAPATPTGWELDDRDEQAGWILYKQPVSGSDHPRYRLVGRTDEPIERVITALQLKSQDDRYLPKGHVRRVVERGDDFFVSHMRIDAPIISDRDAVLRVSWRTEPDTGVHHVEWRQPGGDIPPVGDGAVRIVSEGSWTATPLTDGGTDLVYESHSELGDSVPRWLITRMMTGQIVNELLTLQRILDEDLPDVAASPRPVD
jgi:hypothetical protein